MFIFFSFDFGVFGWVSYIFRNRMDIRRRLGVWVVEILVFLGLRYVFNFRDLEFFGNREWKIFYGGWGGLRGLRRVVIRGSLSGCVGVGVVFKDVEKCF